MKKMHFAILGLLFFKSAFAQLPQLGKNSNAEIIKALTLSEKARLVMGLGLYVPGFGENMVPPDSTKVYNPIEGAAGITYAVPRLGIPAIILADGPAGVRIDPIRPNDANKYYSTAFPIGTLLASTWNVDLIKKVGNALGNEAKERGVDIFLGPAMNTHRNVLGGRNFEYYSEDPLVSAKTASAYIIGVQQNNVGVSLKHFAANNHEANRMKIDVRMSQRSLREIYLKGFEETILASKPWTIMSSYNKINGIYTSQSKPLLTTVLQNEWKYKGLVMTDWFSGDDGALQMDAGNHMIMPGTKMQYNQIMDAVKNGTLKEEVLNNNVERILQLILQTNTFKKYRFSNKPNLVANAAMSKEAATEGMILLKNENNTLPISNKKTTIALLGNSAYKTITGGTGSGDVNKAYVINIADGMAKTYALNNQIGSAYNKFIADEQLKIPTNRAWYMPVIPIPEKPITLAEANEYAEANNIAVLSIGRSSGEFSDRTIENDYELSLTEQQNIKNVSEAFHAKNKKLIVLLNIGGVIEMKSWEKYADAILLVWQPGQEAGDAVTAVVSGKINPSAKLATTFPIAYKDLSTAEGFPGVPDSLPTSITYKEGIYIGYRYFEKFNVPVLYEFGYGKSYTNFSYSNIKINNKVFTNKIVVTVDITNTGSVAGKEIVQLYLSAPASVLNKPVKELRGFVKTNLLAAGQKQTINFTISKRDLCSFDEIKSAWVAEAGIYKISVGSSSKNINLTSSFTLPNTLMVQKVNNVLAPSEPIIDLK